MTDDPLDERRLLASAYLDDELAPAERARAETDDDVMAEVDALRVVRSLVADVPPPDPARRDASITAALGAMPAATHAPRRPPSAARRRRRWSAPLAAAAAAAVIVLGGVVAIRSGGRDDAGDSSAATVTVAAPADRDEAESAGGAVATTTAATALDAGAETTAGAATTAASAEATQVEATEGTDASNAFSDDGSVVLRDADDLLRVANAPAASDTTGGDEAPEATSAATCDLGRFVTVGQYAPDAGPVTLVEIYAIEGTDEIVAAEARTCAILLRATP